LEEGLGPVASGQVAVERALDAGLALLDRRVADGVRRQAALGIAPEVHALPVLARGHADREGLAVHADDPATVDALLPLGHERVAAAFLEAAGGDHLPVAEEQD